MESVITICTQHAAAADLAKAQSENVGLRFQNPAKIATTKQIRSGGPPLANSSHRKTTDAHRSGGQAEPPAVGQPKTNRFNKMRNIMPHGEITSHIATYLSKELSDSNFEVYCAHKSKKVDQNTKIGKIKSQLLTNNIRDMDLAELDIAIVDKNKNNVLVLIEIEETTDKPKVLFGDAFATLFGEMIYISGNRPFTINNQAIMIILVHNKKGSEEDSRINFINREVNKLKSNINTTNARLGRIIFDCYIDEKELIYKIRENINHQFGILGYKIVLH